MPANNVLINNSDINLGIGIGISIVSWVKQGLISAGTHGNSVPLLFDSGNAVPTEMNGPTGTQSSLTVPTGFQEFDKKNYVTYTRQNTQSNYSSFRQSKRR